MRGWRSAKWCATMIWVRVHDLYSAKAVTQNEYMDFLRDIVPMTMPLSMALKLREERDPPTAEPSDAPQHDKEQDKDETPFEAPATPQASDANDVSMDEAGHDASQQEELAGHVV